MADGRGKSLRSKQQDFFRISTVRALIEAMWNNAKHPVGKGPSFALIFLILLLFMPSISTANAMSLYADVRAEAESGVEAKTLAMQSAAVKAFENFIQTSIATRHHERARQLIRRQEARLVESFYVENERTGPRSYTARLRFSIREGVLRQILAEASIPFVREDAPPVLVIPYEQTENGLALNTDGAWYQAWLNGRENAGRAPVRLPRPPFDRNLFDEVTLSMDFDEQRIFIGGRYGTRSVTFAILDRSEDIWRVRFEGEDAIGAISGNFAIEGLRGAPEAGLEAAVSQALVHLSDRWKDAAAQPLAGFADVRQGVRVPLLGGMAEWVRIEAQLRRVAGVRRVDLISLAETHAEADLYVSGDVVSLVNRLSTDFIVLQAEDGLLVIRPATN